MCKFMSAIVLRPNGPVEVLRNAWTDSHDDLVELFNLRDNNREAFARVEFCPKKPDTMDQPDTYVLTIDEQRCPEWFDDDLKAKVSNRMRGWVKAMIVSGDVSMLCGGAYILAKGAKVKGVKSALIHVMMPGSNVGEMRESSKVGEMLGSSKVGVMWESSKVGVMLGSSKVGEMLGSSKVGEMWESSNVGSMWESSKVGVMLRSSKVGEMRESSNVGVMRGSSKVGEMRGSSNVGEMRESSKVGEMRESSNVGVNNSTNKLPAK